MKLRRALTWIGIVSILAGCLVVPIFQQGDTKYFFLGFRYWGSATYIIFLLIVAFAAIAMKKDGMIWVFGLIILGMLINDFRITWQWVSSDNPGLPYDPGSSFRFNMDEDASLSWGWLPLFYGALLLTLTLFLGEDRERLGMVFGSVKAFFASLSPVQPPEDEEEESGDEPAADDQTSEDSQPTSAE